MQKYDKIETALAIELVAATQISDYCLKGWKESTIILQLGRCLYEKNE
jgi:hypothetical protein